jgi:hypothetical protein
MNLLFLDRHTDYYVTFCLFSEFHWNCLSFETNLMFMYSLNLILFFLIQSLLIILLFFQFCKFSVIQIRST